MIMVYCILFILLSFEDFGLNSMKNQKSSILLKNIDMTYTNQLMSFETYQLKLHLPDNLFTDCRME